jgi:hypothetical protein
MNGRVNLARGITIDPVRKPIVGGMIVPRALPSVPKSAAGEPGRNAAGSPGKCVTNTSPASAPSTSRPACRRYSRRDWSAARLSPRLRGAIEPRPWGQLARISQRGRCIGALDLRKSCCKNGLSRRQGKARCGQSVARICLGLYRLKGARWSPLSIADRGRVCERPSWCPCSGSSAEGCCRWPTPFGFQIARVVTGRSSLISRSWVDSPPLRGQR